MRARDVSAGVYWGGGLTGFSGRDYAATGQRRTSVKVLMIAYEFPPTAAGGVMRTVKFCKYLPELGWEPHVLTPKCSTVTSRDPSMLVELGHRTQVHRTRGL